MSMNRRDLLKAGGLGVAAGALASAPPVRAFLNIAMRGLNARAHGEGEVLNYVNFNFMGAPPRWVFDHIYRRTTSPAMVANPMVVTSFGSGGSPTETYDTYDYKGWQVPHLWSTDVTASTGGTRKLETLLDNMIVMRGYGTGIDSHLDDIVAQTTPLASAGSIHGNVADASSSLMKAIQYPDLGSMIYRSPKGTGVVNLHKAAAGDNILESLIAPFKNKHASIVSLQQKYGAVIGEIHAQIRAEAAAKVPDAKAVTDDFQAAQQLMLNQVENLISSWPALFTKYSNLIHQSARAMNVPKLTDRAIAAPAPNGSNEQSCTISDVSLTVYVPPSGSDVRSLLDQADLSQLAQQFALAEFCLLNGLSRSLVFSMSAMDIQGTFKAFNEPDSSFAAHTVSATFDQHYTGSRVSLLLNSALYRGFGAGLLELVDRLKGANLFEKTLVHLTSDFGRTPKNNGGGGDHGFDAMVTSFVTGLRTGGPLVLGNISKNGIAGTAYTGTFGQKALVEGISTERSSYMTPAHVASTLAVLLNLPSNPWINVAAPLMYKTNAGFAAVIDAELVDS